MSVKINPKEVESIEIIGELNGDDVKVVKTKGGYYCAIGKKKRKNSISEPLVAGSHIAIISHQMNQNFGGDFKQSLKKNEGDFVQLNDLTSKLSPNLIESGHNLFSLQKDDTINFIVEKYGIAVLNLEGNITTNGVENLRAILTKKTDDIGVICKELSEII